ncbi:MAG: co-chaperone GroES [Planctomycetota bacterium]|jgi:chaperonin GroES
MAKTKTATVTPLGDRVLVKRVQADEKTKGGIILPDTAKEKPREGLVVAVGKGKLLDNGSRQALQVKTNDRVLFSSYAGSEIKLDGEELLILGEDEILAVIE